MCVCALWKEQSTILALFVVIFFSLTEAPLPDPTQHPETDPKRSQIEPKRSQIEPKRSQTEPKWTEIKLFEVGRAGGFVGVGGVGGCKGKRKSLPFWEKDFGAMSGGPLFSRPLCFAADSICHSGTCTLAVAARAPRDEGRSSHCRPFQSHSRNMGSTDLLGDSLRGGLRAHGCKSFGKIEGPLSCARGPPQFLKKRSENAGSNVNFSGGFAAIPGIAPRVAPRIVGFVLIKS